MKKLLLLLFILGIFTMSAQSADLKNKDIVGDWKYSVATDQGPLTGVIKIKLVEDKLAGEVNDDQGYVFQLMKAEIAGEELLLELQPDYEVVKVKVKLVEGKLNGTVLMGGQDLKIVAEKQQQ